MNEIKPAFASSVDSSQISLSVASGAKTIIGVIGVLLALKGINATPITTNLQMIMDTIVLAIPAGFAVWHAMQTVWGLIRKFFVKSPAVPVVVPVVPIA